MKKLLITIATVIALTACGGSSDGEFTLPPLTPGEEGKEIVINSYGSTITKSPGKNDIVKITGSNNQIILRTKPKSLIITGNDNHIKSPSGISTNNTGSGNTFEPYQ